MSKDPQRSPSGRTRRPRWLAPLVIAAVCHAGALAALPEPAFAQGGGKSVTTLIQRGAELFDDQAYEESIQTLTAAPFTTTSMRSAMTFP